MTEAEKLVLQPPLKPDFFRALPFYAPFQWFKLGIKDTFKYPLSSLAYGTAVFLLSYALIAGLFYFGHDYIIFPALSAFMVLGPAIAVGLYEKSRMLASGARPNFGTMIFFKAHSTGQVLFVGVILMLLVMLWLRAAVLLYALFFGLSQFPGFDKMVTITFTTPEGWSLIFVGCIVGGLFAAFSFAISAFSIPMLLNERKDAFTAMGVSMAMSWSNKSTVLVWGAIVVIMFALALLTALIGLIVIFPILGHATWHAYTAMRRNEEPIPKRNNDH